MSNWGTLYNEVLARSGGGRTSDNDKALVKLAAVDAIARHDSRQLFFNEERFDIQTVASQETYTTADGLPAGIIRFLSPYLFVDRLQVASDRYAIKRVTPDEIDRLRAGVSYESEPECWSYFAETLELYPDPEGVHDIRGKVVVRPGVPIKRNESGTWKFYKPYTTSFAPASEIDDDYPESPDTNAWFTEPLAFATLSYYTEYLLWASSWHGSKGQKQEALEAYLGFLSELEDRTAKLREPREVEPMNLGAVA